ncbi:hypothetical protein CCUS01_04306 [Colletotrichum cuscutae]|uniref:Uncharacterized protein n=1 Tax=Colletotrichum cuscutae TaxID=1209917 RepID=A0AAI9VCT3_9PEZI|nr:hypothetical protein CCUS01_04306 [Colletotrichum cuscutae]
MLSYDAIWTMTGALSPNSGSDDVPTDNIGQWPRPSRRIQTQSSGGSLKANASRPTGHGETIGWRATTKEHICNLIDKELRRQESRNADLASTAFSSLHDHHAVIKRTNWRSVLLISQRFPSLSEVGISAEEPANLQIYATKKLVTACGLAVAKGTRLFAELSSRDKRHWAPSCSSLQIPIATNANSPRFVAVKSAGFAGNSLVGNVAPLNEETETRPRWLAVVEDDIVGIQYARRRRPLPPAHQIYVIVFTVCRQPREPLIELAGQMFRYWRGPEGEGKSGVYCELLSNADLASIFNQIHQGNRLLSPTGPSRENFTRPSWHLSEPVTVLGPEVLVEGLYVQEEELLLEELAEPQPHVPLLDQLRSAAKSFDILNAVGRDLNRNQNRPVPVSVQTTAGTRPAEP